MLLGAMADAGGGRFHFIAGPSDIAAVIRQEAGDAMEVYVRDTRLVVDAPGIRLRSLNGFTAEGGDARIAVRLGDLNPGQHFICGFEVEVPPGERSQTIEFLLRLIDLGGNLIGETRSSLRYSPASEAEAEERNIHSVPAQRPYAVRAALRDAFGRNKKPRQRRGLSRRAGISVQPGSFQRAAYPWRRRAAVLRPTIEEASNHTAAGTGTGVPNLT